jgi:hypothetical protein
MTKQDILRTLEDNGFCHGRIIPKGHTPQADHPNRIVPNAALVTPRHGIVWRGNLELVYEGHKLQRLARKINQNLYVVDEASAAACQAGPPRHLIRHAIWWTCIHETDEDIFGGMGIYHQWHREGRSLKLLSPDPPGKNWAGKLVLADECQDQQQWQQEVSTEPGRQVKPVLLQRSGRYELVWFDHGKAALQPDYHNVLARFGKVEFWSHPDREPIHVQKDGRVVALLWPSPVPNHQTASAAAHELAMRRGPPPAERRRQRELAQLLLDELRPALYTNDARKVYRAVERVVLVLQSGSGGSTAADHFWAATEWRRCPEVEVGHFRCLFKGTDVHVDFLFRDLTRGKNVAEFLAEYPQVTEKLVAGVLEHLAVSLCS